MFTGIVEELGKAAGLDLLADSARLTIHAPLVAEGARPGNSIAVNGVCLTVTAAEGDQFTADVMGETLARSTLGELAPGAPVNLERPAQVGGRLDGHIVQGHVDGTGVISASRPADRWQVLRISIPATLSRYIAEKGSVAVDGVSLTVSGLSPLGALHARVDDPPEPPAVPARVDDPPEPTAVQPANEHWFEVSLIPETLARTTLGSVATGDRVNIEVDVIAKYVERLLAGGEQR